MFKRQFFFLTLLTITCQTLSMEEENSNSNNNNSLITRYNVGRLYIKIPDSFPKFDKLPNELKLEIFIQAIEPLESPSDNYATIHESVNKLMRTCKSFHELIRGKTFQKSLLKMAEPYAQKIATRENLPLFFAACKHGIHHPDIVDKAIQKDPNFVTTLWNGQTALIYAAEYHATPVVQRLITKGANVNAGDIFDMQALIYAAQKEGATNLEFSTIVQLLIDNGADVNARNSFNGMTVLICALDKGATDITKLLIAKGADVNARDNNRRTVLMCAAQWDATDIAQLLIAKGAHVNAQNIFGKTALSYTRSNEMRKLLIKHDATE